MFRYRFPSFPNTLVAVIGSSNLGIIVKFKVCFSDHSPVPLLNFIDTSSDPDLACTTCIFHSVLLAPAKTPDAVIDGNFLFALLFVTPTATPMIMAHSTSIPTPVAIMKNLLRGIPSIVLAGALSGSGSFSGFGIGVWSLAGRAARFLARGDMVVALAALVSPGAGSYGISPDGTSITVGYRSSSRITYFSSGTVGGIEYVGAGEALIDIGLSVISIP